MEQLVAIRRPKDADLEPVALANLLPVDAELRALPAAAGCRLVYQRESRMALNVLIHKNTTHTSDRGPNTVFTGVIHSIFHRYFIG